MWQVRLIRLEVFRFGRRDDPQRSPGVLQDKVPAQAGVIAGRQRVHTLFRKPQDKYYMTSSIGRSSFWLRGDPNRSPKSNERRRVRASAVKRQTQ